MLLLKERYQARDAGGGILDHPCTYSLPDAVLSSTWQDKMREVLEYGPRKARESRRQGVKFGKKGTS